MNIPLVDLQAQHDEVAEEVLEGWKAVIERTAFVLGSEVEEFEKSFAEFVGVSFCVGVANGTDALELAIRAAGLGPGDEVILPTNSFAASALAVARAGCKPVLVDVDPIHYLIDLDRAKDALGKGTRAIMPVHLYGQCAPVELLQPIAEGANAVIIEDAAQAQGSTRNGKHAGSFGIASGSSFYPGKNLGAYGDAGAVLTNSSDLASKVRSLRNYGSDIKYHHPEPGFNSRLDTLQAVVLSAKLRRLGQWNEARRRAALRYDDLLEDLEEVTRPSTLEGNEHIWHLYVIRVSKRDEVLGKLHEAGVGAGIHYPIPIHLLGAFRSLGYEEGDFPIAESAAKEILSLPMYPHITAEQQSEVVDALRKALR